MLSSDELVTVISVKQKVSWQTFNHYLQVLSAKLETRVENTKYLRNNIVRSLESLSFCNFDFSDLNSSWVYACRPAFIRLPSDSAPQFLLVGARTSKSLEELSRLLKTFEIEMQLDNQPYPLIPPRVLIKQDIDNVKRICDEQRISFFLEPPSWRLLSLTLSIREFVQSCEFVSILESNTLRKDFDFSSLQFVNGFNKELKKLYRLSTYFTDNSRPRHKLWLGKQCADVDLSWGRYAVLASVKKSVIAYDINFQSLFIPLLTPLPIPYSRAMALCSGFAPEVVLLESDPKLLYYCYKSVPHLLAKMLASKLDQQLIEIGKVKYERSY